MEEEYPMIVVVDLDGTLCDSSHRDHLARAGLWDDFHGALAQDKPHCDVHWLLDVLASLPVEKVQVIALTGRNEKFRQQTVDWMVQNGVMVDDLIMRPDFDFTSDVELKPRMLLERVPKEQVAFILEDRDKVVEQWRNLGFNCWQCRPGGY